ncbi:MAG: hypothetical protein J6V82_04400 [Clostridia bacterium]|nr:hypothetical protein [Clostridia bacterium]MBO7150972.1 hypothetical protein [Clostridia bacterium]
MFNYIPDNLDRFHAHEDKREAEERAWLAKRPKCAYCGKPITDDECYDLMGDLVCEECLNDKFKVQVDNYVK